MTGVSGCFGGTDTNNIDNMEDVSATVEEIVANTSDNSNTDDALIHLYYYQSVEKRIRMLTLAVVVLAIVVLSKEL